MTKTVTKYSGPFGAIILTPGIIGYNIYKIGVPFLQDKDTSPPSMLDFQYSLKGIVSGNKLFFKNNPFK